MKILFVVPVHKNFEGYCNPANNARYILKRDGKRYDILPTDLPLGPLSMSAYVKKYIDGCEVELIDFNVVFNDKNLIRNGSHLDMCRAALHGYDFNPDIVCISSLFSPSFDNFMDCGRLASEMYPESIILGGGNIATSAYKQVYLSRYGHNFDGLCFGEGEIPLLELLMSSDYIRHLNEDISWITREKASQLDFKPEHKFLNDLDEIPFYDYGLCDLDVDGMSNVATSYATVRGERSFHVMTSRGCPFHCTFCASHQVHGRKMRYHSVARVRSDFEKLRNIYGASTLIFQDDHIMGDPDRVKEILKIVKDLNVEAVFQNGLTLYALTRDMLHSFLEAGVRQLILPVESGSERVLKLVMKKPLKMSITKRVVSDCRELGIYADANVLIGMPGETKEDIEETRKNLLDIKANWYHVVCASPVVGSEMHDIAVKNNYISGNVLGSDYRFAVINTGDFTAEYIQEMQYRLNLELNFVKNSDMSLGRYDIALIGFKNVIGIREDHCFAHYYAAICYRELSKMDRYQYHLAEANKYSKQPHWAKYLEIYGLEIGSERAFYD